MICHSYRLHIQRIDSARNLARFYRLSIQLTLFGDVSVIRNWGRIGTRGHQRVDHCESEKQTVALFLNLLKKKRRKGYRPSRLPVRQIVDCRIFPCRLD